ncbi:FTR1 family iron permease [Tumebacillus sp. ITR2]|uniref:FTR1 family iron permease n=1 Tax=Tumebacillus amylolyticus TaxID=2801339 RepID=A0ABS1J5N5_9BACL|nr:FTR1 family protein [Tumebacillus amylolyticus]MBL0385593.1 FTR1 family iron permease [Tumebacillus amylolyticus]
MLRKSITVLMVFLMLALAPLSAFAASEGSEHVQKAQALIEHAITSAQQGNLPEAQKQYDQFREDWLDFEDTVKSDSGEAYKAIESNMGQIDYALLQNKQDDVVKALQGLHDANAQYVEGRFTKGDTISDQNMTFAQFITLLEQTKSSVHDQDQQTALTNINKVRDSWLSVEGVVVAKSAGIYADTERDMVTANAMITDQKWTDAETLLGNMVQYLSPIADTAGYTMWDAAMIPIREGLEALLVVGALMAFVKKEKNRSGGRWVWGGVLTGLAVSAVLAILIKYIFTSGAFGQNNFLISGWTGVVAAIMLLYMSYWLHSKSNIADWNQYMKEKSTAALSKGNMISLGVLSFLAIFREGTETVLFIIGMVNQISINQLLLGIVIGLGVLVIVAFLMFYVGIKLPMRPFFMVSSLIVFYLCLKFTGTGLHSLQLAGTLSSTTTSVLPSIDFLGFFPSWQSAIPQFALVLFALIVLVVSRKKQPSKTHTQAQN